MVEISESEFVLLLLCGKLVGLGWVKGGIFWSVSACMCVCVCMHVCLCVYI